MQWFIDNKDLVPWVSATLTVIAVCVALFQPRFAVHNKRVRDLAAYRNIAFITHRFVVLTLQDALQDRWHPKEEFDYEVCLQSLDSIKLNEISPPHLIPCFVEIQHMAKRAQKIIHEKIKNGSYVTDTIQRSEKALLEIDSHLKLLNVCFNKDNLARKV